MEHEDYEKELKQRQTIIATYPGDTAIPELFLIDYLLDYEGSGIDSACSSVGMFFAYYYIQKCMVDISIPKAINQLSDFFDYLAVNNYVRADDCSTAKAEMQARKNEWVRQKRDWEKMDYDEYNEKYWGI